MVMFLICRLCPWRGINAILYLSTSPNQLGVFCSYCTAFYENLLSIGSYNRHLFMNPSIYSCLLRACKKTQEYFLMQSGHRIVRFGSKKTIWAARGKRLLLFKSLGYNHILFLVSFVWYLWLEIRVDSIDVLSLQFWSCGICYINATLYKASCLWYPPLFSKIA